MSFVVSEASGSLAKVRFTSEPAGTLAPPLGRDDKTLPIGSEVEGASEVWPSLNPSCSIIATAAS